MAGGGKIGGGGLGTLNRDTPHNEYDIKPLAGEARAGPVQGQAGARGCTSHTESHVTSRSWGMGWGREHLVSTEQTSTEQLTEQLTDDVARLDSGQQCDLLVH